MMNFKSLHANKLTIMLSILGIVLVTPEAHANPAEYYVGKYKAIGYDKQSSTPYKVNISLEKSTAHFLALRYVHGGNNYLGYLEKLISDDGYHFILNSHSKKNPKTTQISYCNYLHNAASMSAEINCHGSLIGNKGYFSLVMQ